MGKLLAALSCLFLFGCTGLPTGVQPVTPLNVDRYLGTWYEVARLDHRFERGLRNVSASYALRADGGVSVLNRGYDATDGEWQQAEGKAYFVSGPDRGHLKVSFFGPFYGSYAVFALDHDYRWAFVAGNSTDYLWLLAREPVISPALRQQFIDQAQALGFDTSQLIWVEHAPVVTAATP